MNDWSLRMASAMISTSLLLDDSSAMTFADVWRMTGRLCPASFAVSAEQRVAASDIRQALWVGLLLYHLSAGERLSLRGLWRIFANGNEPSGPWGSTSGK